MYKRFAIVGFFISFSLYAMELPPSISVEEHDAIMYPLDPSKQELFERAKAKFQEDDADQEGLKDLLALASDHERPHLPAIRKLASIALHNGLYEDSLKWGLHGAAYHDPLCMLSAGSLLLKPELIPSVTQNYDPFSIECYARRLLFDASLIRQFSDSAIFYLTHPATISSAAERTT